MQQKTGIISDLRMLNHKSKTKHPQCPARLKAILKMLEERNYLKHSEVDYVDKYDRLASDQEIRMAYPEKYVKYINQLWPKDSKKTNIYASDSYINQHSEQIARMSTGGVLVAIDQIMKGNWKNGFSIIRPPGHHSGWNDKINGFCILNNIAIGAKYLMKQYSLKKVAILDYDIHRGDGTHYIFNQDPNVLFISIHRYDHGSFYPSGEDGNYDNCGAGKAKGTKVNIPLNYQTRKKKRYNFQAHGDNEYIYIYNRLIHPILEEFEPEFILVSSGFDAARKDYLGGFTVTPNAYYYMTRKMQTLGKPMLCVLEGGYHLISTAQSVTAVIQALLSQEKLPQPIKNVSFHDIHEKCHLEKEYHSDIDDVIEFHSKYWKNLQKEELVEYTKKIKQNEKKLFGILGEEESSSSSSEEEAVKSQEDQMETTAQLYQQSKETTIQVTQKSTEIEPTFLNFTFAKGKVSKLANPKEQEFYSKDFPQKVFAPKYFGKEGNYLILENILFRQKYATVVNIILSKRSNNLKLSEQVREQEAKKQAKNTAMNLGFRVYGITTGNAQQERLTIGEIGTTKKILKEVISNTSKPIFLSFLGELSKRLRQAKRHYFGTNLFLVKGKDKSSIHWTNIYQWYDSDTHDETLISGIDNLAKMIEEIE